MEVFKEATCTVTLSQEGEEFSIKFSGTPPQVALVNATHYNCDEMSVEVQIMQLYSQDSRVQYIKIPLNEEMGLLGMNQQGDLLQEVRIRICKCLEKNPSEGWRVKAELTLS